jgi:hypothetical protein
MKKLLFGIALLTSGCATSDAYLDIQGAAWRKTEAFSATQFAIGVIETSGRNRFDPKGTIKVVDFPVVAQTTYYSDETARAAIQAEGKFKPGVVDVGSNIESEVERRQKSRYVIFRTLDPFKLVAKMNAPENLESLTSLKGQKNPVIVTGTAVSFDNELYKKVDSGLKANASISSGAASPQFKLGGDYSTEVKASFSDGTVFAYEYSAIEWDNSSSVAKVKSLSIDRPMNPWY